MRVVVVSHDSFWPLRGGGGIRVYWVTKKLLDRGHNVTVFAPFLSRQGVKKDFPDLKISDLGRGSRFNKNKEFIYSKLAIKILFRLINKRIDLLYAHNIVAAFPAFLVSRLRNVPLVFDMDDIQLGLSSNRIISTFGPRLEYFIARHSNCVISMSQALTNVLESNGATNIHCIPHGVDISTFSPANGTEREDLIVYMGGVEPHDGVFLIPDAAKVVLTELPTVKFAIIGNGKDLAMVKQKVRSLGLEGSFTFEEWVDQRYIPKYLSRAKIGLVTHTKSIATNVALVLKGLEYMAMELPVVAPDLDGMKEEVGDNERGLLFKHEDYEDLAQKILILLRNPSRCREMGKKGRDFILEYCDWDKNAQRIVEICESYGKPRL